MPRIDVDLSDKEYRALREVCKQTLRDVRDQMKIIIVNELVHLGLIPVDDYLNISPKNNQRQGGE